MYATVEAAGFDAAKRRIVEASGDDSSRGVVFDISRNNVWPAPFTGRCLNNEHLRRWTGRELDLMRAMGVEGERYAAARDAGDFDIAAVIAGEAAGLIHDIPSAAQRLRGNPMRPRRVAKGTGVGATRSPGVRLGKRRNARQCPWPPRPYG